MEDIMEERYMYTVSPRRAIRGLVRGKVIIKPTNLSLTKEEVKMCMKHGAVHRKFYLDSNLERVTPSNLDRLHRKEHLTEDQYKKILDYEMSKKELDLDVKSTLIPDENEVVEPIVMEETPTEEPPVEIEYTVEVEEDEQVEEAPEESAPIEEAVEEEPAEEVVEEVEEVEEPSVDLKKAEEEQLTVESETEEEVQEEAPTETVEEEITLEIPEDISATETKKKSSSRGRRKRNNSSKAKVTTEAEASDSQE